MAVGFELTLETTETTTIHILWGYNGKSLTRHTSAYPAYRFTSKHHSQSIPAKRLSYQHPGCPQLPSAFIDTWCHGKGKVRCPADHYGSSANVHAAPGGGLWGIGALVLGDICLSSDPPGDSCPQSSSGQLLGLVGRQCSLVFFCTGILPCSAFPVTFLTLPGVCLQQTRRLSFGGGPLWLFLWK